MNKLIQIRQGDVLIQQVVALPTCCTEQPTEGNRIVLAYGEVTGHAHAIYDHINLAPMSPAAADEIAENAIARAQSKARLLVAPDGNRYLQVTETVTLKHEEHTQHIVPPGIYHLPTQVEYSPSELRQVAD
jgi:flavin-binding protein dodecin